MLGLVGCSAAAPRESKHVSCSPTLEMWFFNANSTQNFPLFFSFLLQIVWASSHGIAASIGNAFLAPGALVSMDAQRRKRSVVNHCRQSINLAIVSFLEIYISLLCAADCPQLLPYCCLRTSIFTRHVLLIIRDDVPSSAANGPSQSSVKNRHPHLTRRPSHTCCQYWHSQG
jgi:hypothetical protein